MELDKKQDVNPDEIAALRNKNSRLKSAVEELQQDFEKQKETRENELDSLREENRVLLTKLKAMESQVSCSEPNLLILMTLRTLRRA